MKIRKWGLEHHPTGHPIPISIAPHDALDEYVPLLKHAGFYDAAAALVGEHNALVGEVERLQTLQSKEQ